MIDPVISFCGSSGAQHSNDFRLLTNHQSTKNMPSAISLIPPHKPTYLKYIKKIK